MVFCDLVWVLVCLVWIIVCGLGVVICFDLVFIDYLLLLGIGLVIGLFVGWRMTCGL